MTLAEREASRKPKARPRPQFPEIVGSYSDACHAGDHKPCAARLYVADTCELYVCPCECHDLGEGRS